jgi:hypothetical protein
MMIFKNRLAVQHHSLNMKDGRALSKDRDYGPHVSQQLDVLTTADIGVEL